MELPAQLKADPHHLFHGHQAALGDLLEQYRQQNQGEVRLVSVGGVDAARRVQTSGPSTSWRWR